MRRVWMLYGAQIERRAVILLLLGVCQLAAILAPLRSLWALWGNPDRAYEILKAYDRLGNAVANGDSRETISSRADRAQIEGRRWGCILCRLLDKAQPNHCRDSAGV